MLNKMSKVVCKSFWIRCFSVNHSLSTICGISLVLMCSILPATGNAADYGEITFKSKIQRPDCTVSAPTSITLDDILMGYQANDQSVLYLDNKEFELSIKCNNPVNVTSYITIGTQGEIFGQNFYTLLQGVNGVNRKFQFFLEYLEDDKVTQAVAYRPGLYVAHMSNDGGQYMISNIVLEIQIGCVDLGPLSRLRPLRVGEGAMSQMTLAILVSRLLFILTIYKLLEVELS
ncbi:hypothetical protein ACOP3E_04975 [Escherichia coli]